MRAFLGLSSLIFAFALLHAKSEAQLELPDNDPPPAQVEDSIEKSAAKPSTKAKKKKSKKSAKASPSPSPSPSPDTEVLASPSPSPSPAGVQEDGAQKSEKPLKDRRSTWVGLQAGFSIDALLGGTYGAGMGYQYGLSGSFFMNSPWGLKVRLEQINMKESVAGTEPSDYLQANTSLKALEQKYMVLAAGVEKRSEGFFGRQFYWEFLLAYSMGQPSQITLVQNTVAHQQSTLSLTPTTGLAVMLGYGFRREIHPSWMLNFAVRTMATVTSGAFGPPMQKAYFVAPLMFSGSVEYGF